MEIFTVLCRYNYDRDVSIKAGVYLSLASLFLHANVDDLSYHT
jgi:hypothetical protein